MSVRVHCDFPGCDASAWEGSFTVNPDMVPVPDGWVTDGEYGDVHFAKAFCPVHKDELHKFHICPSCGNVVEVHRDGWLVDHTTTGKLDAELCQADEVYGPA